MKLLAFFLLKSYLFKVAFFVLKIKVRYLIEFFFDKSQ